MAKANLNRSHSIIKTVDCKTKPIAVVDIDDTLGNVYQLIIDWAKEEYDKPDHVFTFTDYSMSLFAESLGTTYEEFYQRLKSSFILTKFIWHSHAGTFLNRLQDGLITGTPLRIHLVTKRLNFWNNAVSITKQNCKDGNIPFCELNVISYQDCKVDWVTAKLGKERIALFVEDSTEALEKSLASGIPTMKVPQPYNEHIECDNILDLVEGTVTYNGKTRIF